MASSTALALDAADGVIDGRHFGRPIVQAGPQFIQGGFAQPTFAQPAFASYGATQVAPAFGTAFGSPFGATQFVGGASSTAAALDAADGVIDGRHFGRPIVQAGPQFIQSAPQFVQAAPTFATYGQTFGATQFVGGASSTAAALDAADGVIDGRHFGRPIVQAGAPVGGLVPYTGAAQVAQVVPSFGGQYYGGQRFAGGYAAPQFGGAVPVQQYAGYGYPQQFGATQFGAFGAQSRAAQLDAADGVIDGKFYGRPIVQSGAPGGFPFRR